MTRKFLLKATMLCLAMIACCVTFSACSSDEDDPEPTPTNEPTTIKATYSVSLSDDWYKFFDIEVAYTTPAGVDTILLTEDWNFEMNIPYSAKPNTFVCKVTAKPKANMPAIEDNATYFLEQNVQAQVNEILADGKTSSKYGHNESILSRSSNAEGMKNYVTGEHSLLSFTYTPEE